MKIKYYALYMSALVCCTHSLYSMSLSRLVRAAVASKRMFTPIDAIVPQTTVTDCPICFTATSGYNFRKLSCEHTACIACLQQIIELALKEKTTRYLTCPHCTHPFTENDILSIVSGHEQLDALREIQTADLLRKDQQTHYCPAPNCSYAFIYDRNGCPARAVPAPFTCPACAQIYCPQCMIAHDPRTACPSTADDEILVNTKPCPQCHAPIVKDGGCRYIVCLSCSHNFCWDCMGPYNHVAHWPCEPVAEDLPVVEGFLARPAIARLRGWMLNHERESLLLIVVTSMATSLVITPYLCPETASFARRLVTSEAIGLGVFIILGYAVGKIFII